MTLRSQDASYKFHELDIKFLVIRFEMTGWQNIETNFD